MNEEAAVRRYFGQKGFERFLEQMKRRYMSSKAGARGYITLDNISEEERRVMDEFYETYSPPVPNESKRYSIKKFEAHLLKSRFSLTVPDLLAILSGQSVLTRLERQRYADAQWERMIREAIMDAGLSADEDGADKLLLWADGLRHESSPGIRTLRTVFTKSASEAGCCLKQCLAALRAVIGRSDEKPIRLPILAAQVTGDAHALDWKYPLGRLFWWGLTAINGQSPCGEIGGEDADTEMAAAVSSGTQAIMIRDGYRKGGVADDDLSSYVMLYAPILFGQSEERILTLRQVEQLTEENRVLPYPLHIFMVENPSVFAELIDMGRLRQGAAGAASSCIITCGNGQPTTAVIKLTDWLTGTFATSSATLYYAGDLDPVGLSIAQSLQARYTNSFRAWFMDKELYLRYAHRGIELTEAERTRVQQSQFTSDPELVGAMAENGVKLHQELWIDEIKQDFAKRNCLI